MLLTKNLKDSSFYFKKVEFFNAIKNKKCGSFLFCIKTGIRLLANKSVRLKFNIDFAIKPWSVLLQFYMLFLF